MAKTGPLGKLEKYFIEGNYESMDVDALAKEMDRSKTAIKNYIKKLTAKTEDTPVPKLKVGDTIPIRNNPTVMTQADAERADEISGRGTVMTQRLMDCIAPSKRE